MTPSPVFVDANNTTASQGAIPDLKAKMVDGHVEVQKDPPPVADNFMYDFKYNHALPTLDVLGVSIDESTDPMAEALELREQLESALSSGNAAAFADMFLPYGA